MFSKSNGERIHFKKRFLQRHGIVIKDEDINLIREKIYNCKIILIKRISNRLRKYAIRIFENDYIIIWDFKRDEPVTVLPDNKSTQRILRKCNLDESSKRMKKNRKKINKKNTIEMNIKKQREDFWNNFKRSVDIWNQGHQYENVDGRS